MGLSGFFPVSEEDRAVIEALKIRILFENCRNFLICKIYGDG